MKEEKKIITIDFNLNSFRSQKWKEGKLGLNISH